MTFCTTHTDTGKSESHPNNITITSRRGEQMDLEKLNKLDKQTYLKYTLRL